MTQILEQGLWGICLQEAASFAKDCLDEIINDPRLEGKWSYIHEAYPQIMGKHHGLAILYRCDMLSILKKEVLLLPKSDVSPTEQIALVATFLHNGNCRFQIVNFRLVYEGPNEFRLGQLIYIAENLEDCQAILFGDSNLKCFSQLKHPLGWLSLVLKWIPARLVVENKKNRRKIAQLLPDFNNLIPSTAYTIEPFRCLPPGKILDWYNCFQSITHLKFFLRMQLDYILPRKSTSAKFGKVIHTEYADHSMVTCTFIP